MSENRFFTIIINSVCPQVAVGVAPDHLKFTGGKVILKRLTRDTFSSYYDTIHSKAASLLFAEESREKLKHARASRRGQLQ